MNVAIWTELYAPSVGGQEIRFAELASALQARGHVVTVYCIGHDSRLAHAEVVDGVQVRRHPVVRRYQQSRVPGLPRSVSAILRYAAWCRRVSRRGAHDVHVFNQWPLIHIAAASRGVRRRGVIDWCEVREGLFYRLVQQSLPRLTARNMGVSTAVAGAIERASGQAVVTLPSGIRLRTYRCAAREDRAGILYVGRIAAHKRVPLLVRTFGMLAREGFDEPLCIAGTGPDADSVSAAVEALDPSARARVRVLGHVADDEKARLLAESSVLVLPSEREGFPRVVAEAMASGLPVVTTDDPGNGTRHVVAEFQIGVVSPANPAQLASAIHSAQRDAARFAENGLAAAPALDWDRLAQRFELMAAELLAD